MIEYKKTAITALLCGIITALFSTAANATERDISASAKLDSTVMIMGSKTALRIEFVGNFGDEAHTFINPEEWDKVEINETDSAQINDLGNNRRELRAMFMVQAFDSGLYTLPPIYLISGKDTIATNSPILKVDPIALDTANVVFKDGEPIDIKVHGMTDVVDAEEKLLDFVPDWMTVAWPWILLTLLLIGLLVFVYMKWLRHGQIPLIPIKKPVPPYELAVGRLNDLREKKLWQQGAEKEYYTELTDILRGYLSGRFGINAMEMTTPQIILAISNSEEAKEFAAYVDGVLREADFVKFAKAKPSAPENEAAFANVRQFVELTKPVEKTEESEAEMNTDSDSKEKQSNNVTK